jgi:hypothetical protein
MLTEIATITVLDAQENYLDEAFQRISEDLRRTPHCKSFLLTQAPETQEAGQPQRYILSSTWDGEQWRAFAWRYFIDVFMSWGVIFHVSSHVEQETEAQMSQSA